MISSIVIFCGAVGAIDSINAQSTTKAQIVERLVPRHQRFHIIAVAKQS